MANHILRGELTDKSLNHAFLADEPKFIFAAKCERFSRELQKNIECSGIIGPADEKWGRDDIIAWLVSKVNIETRLEAEIVQLKQDLQITRNTVNLLINAR